MTWLVYREYYNDKKIGAYDIFQHGRFLDDVKKTYEKYKDDFDTFKSKLERELLYYFWSKCEWEIVLNSWPEGRCSKKVDVYDQVMLNFDVFAKYVWEELHERQKRVHNRKSV